MSLKDKFMAAGGVKILCTNREDDLRVNSGFSKSNSSDFGKVIEDVLNGAENIKLTPTAVKNLAKEQPSNLNNNSGLKRGRADYD